MPRITYPTPRGKLFPLNANLEKQAFVEEDGIYAYTEGRMYDRWIDYSTVADATRNDSNGSVGDPGYNDGDLIKQPAYIVESVLRDECFIERDLTITSYVSSTSGGGYYTYVFTCTGVKSSVDDYYNNAIMTKRSKK